MCSALFRILLTTILVIYIFCDLRNGSAATSVRRQRQCGGNVDADATSVPMEATSLPDNYAEFGAGGNVGALATSVPMEVTSLPDNYPEFGVRGNVGARATGGASKNLGTSVREKNNRVLGE